MKATSRIVPSQASDPSGIVQQNQSTERVALGPFGDDVCVNVFDLGTERIAERCEALQWGSVRVRSPDGPARRSSRPPLRGIKRRFSRGHLIDGSPIGDPVATGAPTCHAWPGQGRWSVPCEHGAR